MHQNFCQHELGSSIMRTLATLWISQSFLSQVFPSTYTKFVTVSDAKSLVAQTVSGTSRAKMCMNISGNFLFVCARLLSDTTLQTYRVYFWAKGDKHSTGEVFNQNMCSCFNVWHFIFTESRTSCENEILHKQRACEGVIVKAKATCLRATGRICI